jgi:hypothetical protein
MGPINELLSAVMAILGEHVPRDLTWPMLLLMLAIATAIWLIRDGWGAKGVNGRVSQQSLIPFLLPKEIYTHTSAKVDVGLYVVERFLPSTVGYHFFSNGCPRHRIECHLNVKRTVGIRARPYQPLGLDAACTVC